MSKAGKKGAEMRWGSQKRENSLPYSLAITKNSSSSSSSSSINSISYKSPAGRDRKEKKEYIPKKSTEQVNSMLKFLAELCGVAAFADGKSQDRKFAWNFVRLAQKIGEDEFQRKISHLKNSQDLTKFKKVSTLYYHFKTIP